MNNNIIFFTFSKLFDVIGFVKKGSTMSYYQLERASELAPETVLTTFSVLNTPKLESFLSDVSEWAGAIDEERDPLKARIADVAVNGLNFHGKLLTVFSQDEATVQAQISPSELGELLGPEADQGWSIMSTIGDIARGASGNTVRNVVAEEQEPERTESGLAVSVTADYDRLQSGLPNPYIRVGIKEAVDLAQGKPISLTYSAGLKGGDIYKRLIQVWNLDWRTGQTVQSVGIATMRQYYQGTGDTIRLAGRQRVIEPDGELVTRAMYRLLGLGQEYQGGSRSLSQMDQSVIDTMLARAS